MTADAVWRRELEVDGRRWLVYSDFPLCADVAEQLVRGYRREAPCRVLVLPGVYADIEQAR